MRLLTKFDNVLAINLTLNLAHSSSVNFKLQYMVFVISSQFLPILLTSFSIGTEKVMFFTVFSPKKENCSSGSSASSSMIKR